MPDKKKTNNPESSPPEPEAISPDIPNFNELSENLIKIAAKSQKLLSNFLAQQSADHPDQDMDPLNIGSAFLEFTNRMMADPSKLVEHQMSLVEDGSLSSG